MSPRHWTITIHESGQPREVEVVLYERVADMRRAATRFARVVGEKAGSFNDAAGVCHGFQRIRVNADGTEKDSPLVSIIRLHQEALTVKVLSHEVAHAAQHIYGIDLIEPPMTDAIDHFHSANEAFAHLYGELYAAAWSVLSNGIVDEAAYHSMKSCCPDSE
jgi:hypothetical protein